MKKLKTRGDLKDPHRKFLRIITQAIEESKNGFEYVIDERKVEYDIT